MLIALQITNGKDKYLPNVLVGLANQQKTTPDKIIIAVTQNKNSNSNQSEFEKSQKKDITKMALACGLNLEKLEFVFISNAKNISQAISGALNNSPKNPDDLIWVLHSDSVPKYNALDSLYKKIDSSQKIAVVGCKQLAYDSLGKRGKNLEINNTVAHTKSQNPKREYVLEVGVQTSKFCNRIELIEGKEPDQGQYDAKEDVLGVGSAGMLFRYSEFISVGGFDRYLGPYFEGLDFCEKIRASGYRVVVEPKAIVYHARQSFEKISIQNNYASSSREYLRQKSSQIYFSCVHSRFFAFALFIAWVNAIYNFITNILSKDIGFAFCSLFAVAKQNVGRILIARAKIRQISKVSKKVILELKLSRREIRQIKKDRLEDKNARVRDNFEIIEHNKFIAQKAKALGCILLFTLVLSIWAFRFLFNTTGLNQGGLLPYNKSILGGWQFATSAWQQIGTGFSGPSDPFGYFLALLNTLFLGAGNIGIEVFYFSSPILVALGAWLFAGSIGLSIKGRVWFSIAWVIMPAFWVSLAQGRLGAILVFVVLLPYAWAIVKLLNIQPKIHRFEKPYKQKQNAYLYAGIAGLLLALLTAGSPILLPIAFIVLVVFIKQIKWKIVPIFMFSIVLFLPSRLQLLKSPKMFFVDPGPVLTTTPHSFFYQLLGWPLGLFGFDINSLAHSGKLNTQLSISNILHPDSLFSFLALIAGLLFFCLAFSGLFSSGIKGKMSQIGIFVALVGATGILFCNNVKINENSLYSAGVTAVTSLGFLLCATGAARGLFISPLWKIDTFIKTKNKNFNNNFLPKKQSKFRQIATVCILGIITVATITNIIISFSSQKEVLKYSNDSNPIITDISASGTNAIKTLKFQVLSNGKLQFSIQRGSTQNIEDVSAISYINTNKDDFLQTIKDILNSNSVSLPKQGIGYIYLQKNDLSNMSSEKNLTENKIIQALDSSNNLTRILEEDNKFILWGIQGDLNALVSRAVLVDANQNIVRTLPVGNAVPIKINLTGIDSTQQILISENYNSSWKAQFNKVSLTSIKAGWQQGFSFNSLGENAKDLSGTLEISYNNSFTTIFIPIQIVIFIFQVLLALPVLKKKKA